MKNSLRMKRSPILWAILLLSLSPVLARAQDSKAKDEVASAAGVNDKEKKDTSKTNTAKPQDTSSTFFNQLRGTFEIGGQVRDLSGERPSKFQEFTQVRDGFMFRRFHIVSNPEGSPYFFRMTGRGPSERDQLYLLDGGKYGRFRTNIEFVTLPHLYSTGDKSLFGSNGKGILTIPDAVQSSLQNTADADLPAAVQRLLAETPLTLLRVQRQSLKFEQRLNLTDRWSVRFRAFDEKKFGTRPLGTGSYERVGTPLGDTFRAMAIELPEPVDYRTDTFTLGTSYVAPKWGINFDYTYSRFSNRIETLIFDNPFRVTDLQANPGGGTGRMRFARGLFSLAPDNHSQSLLLSAFVDLPHDSRFASALGWSFWRQDEPFVPYTLNSAIVATGLPAGTNPTQVESLPARSLNGEVDTFSQDHLFTSRLTSGLTVNLRYRYYDYSNGTPILTFPGYAAYGESYWRTNIVTVPGTNPPVPVPLENEPVSFLKQNATAEMIWRVVKAVTWKLEYGWEGANRTHRQVAQSNEHTIGTQLSLKATDQFSAKLRYRYADRIPDFYDPGLKEFNKLRLFDQSKRLRHDLDLQWQWRATPQLGISGTLGYLSDDYDQHFFGLTKYVSGYGSIDALYTLRDNATFYVNFSRDQIHSQLQSIAKTAAPYNLNNRWDRLSRDVVDTFGVGVTAYGLKDKLMIDSHYAFSSGDQRITTANPLAIVPTDALNAKALAWPDITTRFHEWNSDVSYQFTEQWGLGMRYIFEPYRLNDFAWNKLAPYPVTQLAPENDGRRFLLLDSRYSSFDAHVVGFYVRFSFGGKRE